tara:strand:- start:184 stop:927 length:744 start_codon:yes stop_codon:yes gene_type:complete
MPLIQSGKTFNDGEQLTAGKLNQMFSDANLSTAGVDGTSIIVNANDVLAVRSINSSRIDTGAVITDKLPDSTVTATDGTPDGVTFPKLQHIETDKILGRTTTGDGIVETIGLNTDDAMASASATTLATDGSIKAYVDTLETNPVDLTLLNNAVAYGVSYEVPSYYRTKDNIVHLRGLMKDSTANPVATLPSGFRPAKQLVFATIQSDPTITYGSGRVDVKVNGDIELRAASSGYNSLDGIAFLADGT